MPVWVSSLIGGLITALAAIFGPLLLEKLKHRNKKEDQTVEIIRKDLLDYKTETNRQILEFKTETGKRLDKVDERITQLSATTDSLVKNEVARTYVAIRQQALLAIRRGKITARDKEKLLAEYDRYLKLPNSNSFLKDTIEAMKRLDIIVEDDDLQ